jgi:hypothetical protein
MEPGEGKHRAEDGLDSRRRRLSPALVISLIALFLSLGGVGYAALRITGKDVVDGSLTGKDVANHSLRAKDFKPGDLPAGARGAPGPQGLQGIQGVQGLQGLQGQQGTPAPGPEAVTRVIDAPAAPTNGNCTVSPPAIGQFCGVIDGTGAYNRWRSKAGYQPLGFYKDGQGLVHIEGEVDYNSTGGGASGTTGYPGPTIFVLPDAYRPAAKRLFSVYNVRSNPDFITVGTDGHVDIGSANRSELLQLDGINYRP